MASRGEARDALEGGDATSTLRGETGRVRDRRGAFLRGADTADRSSFTHEYSATELPARREEEEEEEEEEKEGRGLSETNVRWT